MNQQLIAAMTALCLITSIIAVAWTSAIRIIAMW